MESIKNVTMEEAQVVMGQIREGCTNDDKALIDIILEYKDPRFIIEAAGDIVGEKKVYQVLAAFRNNLASVFEIF